MNPYLPPPAATNPIPTDTTDDLVPAPGDTVTVRRTTRSGPVSWTGTLVAVGSMERSDGPMGYVVVDTDRGRQTFAIDPALHTTVELA